MERRFLKLTILSIFLIICIAATFWRDAYDFLFDLYRGAVNERQEIPALKSSDLSKIESYTIEREKNNNRHLSRTNLHIKPNSRGSLDVSFDLVSSVRGDDYPSLRVILYSGAGKATRYVDYGPVDYAHGSVFYKETVSFEVVPSPGESSLDVRPFYKD